MSINATKTRKVGNMSKRYNNYHKHDHRGNPWFSDSVTQEYEYADRAKELQHTTLFTVNHGVTGSVFEWLELSKENNMRMCYGTEAYFVPNRLEKDGSNKHIIIVAKNNDGFLQLNDIMSEAHTTGFYRRPRIDTDLLFSLEPNNFIITSACIAGLWDEPELLLALKNRFGDNFFLELQDHNIDLQKEVNRQMLHFSNEAKIPIIHGNDSHYIKPSGAKYRTIYQRGKDIYFSDDNENDMILDYPTYEEIEKRYKKQGILSNEQIYTALDNTLVFDTCEEITVINDDIKLPPFSKTPNEDLKKIINESWKKERDVIPTEKHAEYLQAIREEYETIEKTNTANYFLIDNAVVERAEKVYGGKTTNTGRGSAVSFYINKLLGLTNIDRLEAPVTLYPSRFMSVERILQARSLPDVDINTADRQPFIQATKDLLGEDNCEWMLAWKPLQEASAFRTYCKGLGMHISEYDEIAKHLDDYKDTPKWSKIIKESRRFIGVVDSVSESPCSMVLHCKPVRRELGLVHTKTGIMCLLDGYNCDKYKYLKNDYLSVTVWAIIKDVCDMIGMPIPTIRELNSLLDDETWEIYEKGLTCTINQVDSDFATPLVQRYKPHTVAEMSSFIAIVRPGCASLRDDFLDRKPYTTGVPVLDEQLKEGEHRMIYQELIMKYLMWLGIPAAGSYDIIKKISKKKFKAKELEELKSKLIEGWINNVGTKDGFKETWTVVEQAASYSFNASHSLSYAYDSLYGAYLKSHYPLEYYTVVFNTYQSDLKKTKKLTKELPFFDIKLAPIQFRYSKSDYFPNKEQRTIYKGIGSIKDLNGNIADEMYKLKDNQYKSFIDLLIDIKNNTSVGMKPIKILIELDFFKEFGDTNKLIEECNIFSKYYGRKQVDKSRFEDFGVPVDILKMFSKETKTQFREIQSLRLIDYLCTQTKPHLRTLTERVSSQIERLGYVDVPPSDKYANIAAVVEIDTKYSPRLKLHSLKNNTMVDCKINKNTFRKLPLKEGQIIQIINYTTKPKTRRLDNGDYVPIEGTSELWLNKYKIMNI